MRYNLHIFFTVKIQKFTPYAPFLPPVFIINKTPFLTIIEKEKEGIINKTPFLTIMPAILLSILQESDFLNNRI